MIACFVYLRILAHKSESTHH